MPTKKEIRQKVLSCFLCIVWFLAFLEVYKRKPFTIKKENSASNRSIHKHCVSTFTKLIKIVLNAYITHLRRFQESEVFLFSLLFYFCLLALPSQNFYHEQINLFVFPVCNFLTRNAVAESI